MRQFHEWGNCDQGRHILIAVARYLAAHFPTLSGGKLSFISRLYFAWRPVFMPCAPAL